MAVLLRTVHDPALAFDLATETLAAASTRWDEPPPGERGLIDVIALAQVLLARAAERGRVPVTERRRRGLAPHRLTVEQLRELIALSEHPLDLPPEVRQAAEQLARSAPPPSALRELSRSELIDADSLHDHERSPNGA